MSCSAWHILIVVNVIALLCMTSGSSDIWPLDLLPPELTGDPAAVHRGATCSQNCTLLVMYHSHPGAVARRGLLRTFVRKYIGPDIDMVFFVDALRAEPFKNVLALENATSSDIYLVTGSAYAPEPESVAVVSLSDGTRYARNLFGDRYAFYAAASETTILQPVVLKHKLLGIGVNFTAGAVFCIRDAQKVCSDALFAYSRDVGAAVSQASPDPQAGVIQLAKAVLGDQLHICKARPGFVEDPGKHRHPQGLAVPGVHTTDAFMASLNMVLWNLAAWYQCDTRGFAGEACAGLVPYFTKHRDVNMNVLQGCDVEA
jgi:hypothetical protein